MSLQTGSITQGIEGQLTAFGDLVAVGGFLAGILLGMVGIFKFKSFMENPQTTSISSAIMPMMVASAMIALPAFFNFTQNSVSYGEVERPGPVMVQEEAPVILGDVPAEPVVIPPSQIDGMETGQRDDARWVTERAIK